MDRRSFIPRLALALGAVFAAGREAVAGPLRKLAPASKAAEVRYKGLFRVHPVTGEVTPHNTDAHAMIAAGYLEAVQRLAAKAGLPKDDKTNTLCGTVVTCSCGGGLGNCGCAPHTNCGWGLGQTCNCCWDPTYGGSCCQCDYLGGSSCLVSCPVYGCYCS